MGGVIRGRMHILPVRIYYEDTDFSGFVYHANYVRYMERGRSDYLRLAGVSHTEMAGRDEPLAFTIRHVELDFLKPARIDDALEVRTCYDQVAGARIRARQDIYRGTERLLAARVEAACISMEGRPRRLPKDLMAHLGPYVGLSDEMEPMPGEE